MLLLVEDTMLYRNEVPSTEVTTALYISYETCNLVLIDVIGTDDGAAVVRALVSLRAF